MSLRYVLQINAVGSILRTVFLQDLPLKNWIPLRDEYLNELLRLEGRGDPTTVKCPTCDADPAVAEPIFRCRDCLFPHPRCSGCLLTAHAHHPFHRIEVRPRFIRSCAELIIIRDGMENSS